MKNPMVRILIPARSMPLLNQFRLPARSRS